MLNIIPDVLTERIIVLQVPNLVLFERGEDGLGRTKLHGTLTRLLREHEFGLLIADPLVETHAGLDENSNTDMMFVIKGLRDIARRCDIPALVVHHSRRELAVTRTLPAAAVRSSTRAGSSRRWSQCRRPKVSCYRR